MRYNEREVAASKFVGRFLQTAPEHTTAKKTEDQAGEDDGGNPLLHHDAKVRKATHKILKTVHRHVFSADTKDLQSAKEKHAAILAMTAPADDDDKQGA